MEDLIRRAAKDIIKAQMVSALTGAGMSAESGIPTFRDPGGFWEKYNPEEYAHIDTFYSQPEKPWRMVKDFDIKVKAKPNSGHIALSELEALGFLREIITQNVDNLHQQAGNSQVIEFHGNLRRAVCLTCGRYYELAKLSLDILPPRCECNGILKPDAVFFGEPIPTEAYRRAYEAARSCKLMLVVGTSAVVYPAASIPQIAKQAGATVVEVNPQPTPLTGVISDYIIIGKAGVVLPEIVSAVKKLLY
ncbi:MAG: NAD-dependent deacylase [Desulfobacterota bacterium]|nr:NAD-dependent deacylase [Thermodesulfobacteriota bacterium]